ncbi:MAG: hypothetical protein Q4P83_03840 [Spirochaetales bacterium]|nr:hypothetical protein [Spirochaetales bacterium]
MELLSKENISVLPQKYWLTPGKEENKKDYSKKESVTNVTALIISALTEIFPELAKCPENKFINFQDKVSRILSRLN